MGQVDNSTVIRRIAPLLVLAALVCIFLGPVLFGGRVLLPCSFLSKMLPWSAYAQESASAYWEALTWDDVAIFYPARVFLGQALRSGEIPLWNPYQFCGQPFLADGQSGVFYPPNLLFAVMPADRAMGLLAALHLLAAGCFAYIFLRGLKLRESAACFGALAFMLSGFAVTWLQAPAFLSAGAWLPLMLHLSRLAYERKSVYYSAGAGITIALSLLGGHPQIAFYCMLAVGFYWIYLIASGRDEVPVLHSGMLALMALVIGVMLAAPQLLATSEFAALSHRAGHAPTAEGYAGYSRLAMPLGHLITLFIPDFFGNPSKGTYWGANEYPEYCAYIGILPLLLLPMAFARSRRNGHVWFFAGLGLLALLMAAGTGVNRLFYFGLPGFTKSGSPARVLVLFVFAASMLSAFGMNRLLDSLDEKRSRTPRWVLAAGLGMLVSVVALLLVNFSRLSGRITFGDLVYQVLPDSQYFFTFLLAGGLLVVLASTGRLSRSLGAALLLCALAADLLAFGMWYNPTCSRSEVFPSTELTDFLKENTHFERIMPLNEQWSIQQFPNAVLPPNTTSVYRLFDVQGYNSLYQVRYKALLDAAAGGESCPPENGNILFARNYRSPVYDLLGVRWFISTHPLDGQGQEMEGCYVYRNPDALPRAFVARTIEYADDAEMLRRIVSAETNLRNTVLVSPKDAERLDPWKEVKTEETGELPESDSAVITKYTCNTVTVEIAASRPGAIVLTDQYFPGWQASVDGKNTPIVRADYIFRAVPVQAGKHTVVFSYEPASYRKGLGAAWTAILFLVCLGLVGLSQRGKKR